MMVGRRKKWTESEERSLIDKYGEMVSDGSLAKMKSREKKFRPIALFVNSLHHHADPLAHPWLWSWKDVSTKVQNMRHQYLLVKQKITKPGHAFDWGDGLAHWSNFARYKDVFGDFEPVSGGKENGDGADLGLDIAGFGPIDGFEYNGEEENDDGFVYEEAEEEDGPGPSRRRKRRRARSGLEKKAWAVLRGQLEKLQAAEARLEQSEAEREVERRERERRKDERGKARARRFKEWEAVEREDEIALERERRRREDEVALEREREARRAEWRERMEAAAERHRAEMGELRARITHEQQGLAEGLLGVVSQWTAHPAVSEHASASNHYFSQMMQSLHHVNGLVDDDDARVEGESQGDQFLVNG